MLRINTVFFTRSRLSEALVFILSRRLGLFAAFDAGALIVFLLAEIRQNASLGAIALKSFQGTIQGLIILDMNFRHHLSLPFDSFACSTLS
jgi:hypothetical protein